MQEGIDIELLDDLFPDRRELLLNLFEKIRDFNFEMYNDFESLKNIILIDSPFGTGKTFFAKTLKGYLEKNNINNINSIYFDAWENDYEKEPFVVISKHIFKELMKNVSIIEKAEFFIKEKFFKLIENIFDRNFNVNLGIDTKIIKAKCDTTINPKEVFIDSLKEPKDPIEEFKNGLEKLIEDLNSKKLVLIIDELDRCRPDYAMKLLEIVKHFFNIKGLIIIVFENKKALNNSIKSLYNFDNEDNIEENYISKFFIEEIKLYPIDYAKFIIDELCNKFNFKTEIAKKEFKEENENISSFYILRKTILNLCLLNPKISCRDLKLIIGKIVDFYNKVKIDKRYNDWEYIVPEIFKKYFSKIKDMQFIEHDKMSFDKQKPYFYLSKKEYNSISFVNDDEYFDKKYKILNHLNYKYTNIFTELEYLLPLEDKDDIIFFQRLFMNKIYEKNYMKKIFFNFCSDDYIPALIDGSKTFKEYFNKAKERINILKSKDFSNINGVNTEKMVNKLIKVFAKYDKKVEDFKNKYGNTDDLSEDEFSDIYVNIRKTIRKIFFINNYNYQCK